MQNWFYFLNLVDSGRWIGANYSTIQWSLFSGISRGSWWRFKSCNWTVRFPFNVQDWGLVHW
jgi:hypothetical protein